MVDCPARTAPLELDDFEREQCEGVLLARDMDLAIGALADTAEEGEGLESSRGRAGSKC